MNSWPMGYRHAMDQGAHEKWNAVHYPGTRQICSRCDSPTGRCEDDTLSIGDGGPLCEECWQASEGG
jgi:hypothetical protein